MKKSKILAILLVLVMSLSACGSSDTGSSGTNSNANNSGENVNSNEQSSETYEAEPGDSAWYHYVELVLKHLVNSEIEEGETVVIRDIYFDKEIYTHESEYLTQDDTKTWVTDLTIMYDLYTAEGEAIRHGIDNHHRYIHYYESWRVGTDSSPMFTDEEIVSEYVSINGDDYTLSLATGDEEGCVEISDGVFSYTFDEWNEERIAWRINLNEYLDMGYFFPGITSECFTEYDPDEYVDEAPLPTRESAGISLYNKTPNSNANGSTASEKEDTVSSDEPVDMPYIEGDEYDDEMMPVEIDGLPTELMPYASLLKEKGHLYWINLQNDDDKLNIRSEPDARSKAKDKFDNVVGELSRFDEVYVEYIYDDAWAVFEYEGEYVFAAMYYGADKNGNPIMYERGSQMVYE